MKTYEDNIQLLAFQIWESEGKPEGKADEHWAKARILAVRNREETQPHANRSVDPSEANGPTEPEQPDQT